MLKCRMAQCPSRWEEGWPIHTSGLRCDEQKRPTRVCGCASVRCYCHHHQLPSHLLKLSVTRDLKCPLQGLISGW